MLLSSGTEDLCVCTLPCGPPVHSPVALTHRFLSAQYFDLGTYNTPIAGCTTIRRVFDHSFTAYKMWEEVRPAAAGWDDMYTH